MRKALKVGLTLSAKAIGMFFVAMFDRALRVRAVHFGWLTASCCGRLSGDVMALETTLR
jgi:hypothetical protein